MGTGKTAAFINMKVLEEVMKDNVFPPLPVLRNEQKVLHKTKELIGVIKAAEALATVDDKYDHPLLDSMLELSKEINGLIENSSVGETL